MRLQTYLNETIDPYIVNSIWKKLTKDCMPFLKELKKSNSPRDKFFYRGFHGGNLYSEIDKKKVRTNRNPMDTPQAIHDILNKSFKKKFGWNVRGEGSFATSDKERAGGYGTPFLFFPVGKYKYVWSEEVSDLYQYLGGHHLKYTVDALNGAVYDIIQDYNFRYGENKEGEWYYDGEKVKSYPDGPHVFKDLGLTIEEYDREKLKWIPDVNIDDYVYQKRNETIDEFEKSVNRAMKTYQTNNMRDAMISQSEVVFKCKEYYAVKTIYALPLYELMEKEL
jgi:hypothetical protein